MTYLLAGFALGLAGGVHCLGMCGPLVWAVRAQASPRALLHHAGRLLTYAALGALAGGTGGVIARAGWRNTLAVTAGTALLLSALTSLGLLSRVRRLHRLDRAIATWIAHAIHTLNRHRAGGAFGLGVLNGLLPCGLVYAALAGAAGLGDAMAAVVFMTGFAVGTLPAFAALAISAGALTGRLPSSLRRAAPIAVALAGLLLVARGLQAGPGHQH
jgi:sulfite exporter TauE/SafE